MRVDNKQTSTFKRILDDSIQFYADFLGYVPQQTVLHGVPENQWNEFVLSRGLQQNSHGIYLPRNQVAIVRGENPLSLFHEYFGHGLYCEQSLLGRRLVVLEKKLLEEEKQEFSSIEFSSQDLQEFRRQSRTFQELENLKQADLGRHEFFAIWTEYLLSGKHGLRELFELKYDVLPAREREFVDSVIDFSKTYGDLATMYAQGMARISTPERVKKLIEGVYGRNKVLASRLVIMTGSRKPFSDIDLFASSDFLSSLKTDWLDCTAFTEEDFEKRVALFDPQIVYPILWGEFVSGDRNYLFSKQKQLEIQPITNESIRFNLERAEKNRQFAESANDEDDKRVSLSYAYTYLENALALQEGKRLTFKNLNSQRTSVEDDKPLQVEGGYENNA